MYITMYDCVFLKLGESIYVAMDLIPILLGSLPLAHNAQHSLVIMVRGPIRYGTRYPATILYYCAAFITQRVLQLRFIIHANKIVIMRLRSANKRGPNSLYYLNASYAPATINHPRAKALGRQANLKLYPVNGLLALDHALVQYRIS